MCKTDLAKAGYPNGVTLSYMYPNDSSDTRIFTAIQASLAPCGITLTGKPEPGSSSASSPWATRRRTTRPASGTWARPSGSPTGSATTAAPWSRPCSQGPNCVINTVNYGCYDNATVNSLITQAENAPSLAAAGNYWHQADMQIMSDAAIVPIMSQDVAVYSSARVRGIASNGQTYPTAIFAPNIGAPDITALWIAGG